MEIHKRIKENLGKLVPDPLEGTDNYLDIITWNIKFFSAIPDRIDVITSIMKELKADIFVLQEIEFGSMDEVANLLTESEVGKYKVIYGGTGGDIRVAFMYNLDTVRAKRDVVELFKNENLIAANGKLAFPRLPLCGYFQIHRQHEQDPFDFELVGVHLKSQRGPNRSQEQRNKAAERLRDWIMNETEDEDVIIAGDWNASLEHKEWEPLKDLQEDNIIKFNNFNDNNEISHLFGRKGSRLDLVVITDNVPAIEETKVIRWNKILDCNECEQFREIIKDQISDHLPVISRFYWNDKDSE